MLKIQNNGKSDLYPYGKIQQSQIELEIFHQI